MPEHTVEQGECVHSIAAEHGLFWQTIWDHPDNAELRELRGSPSVLHPGDVLFVPDIRRKEVTVAMRERHRFRRRGVPAVLRLRMVADGEPVADTPFELEFDGRTVTGTTDAEGRIVESIPPGTREGTLYLGEDRVEYPLQLGALDPVEEVTGVQARLKNLGYDCGRIDGDPAERTQAAIRQFQEAQELEVTGELDQATKDRLRELHGS